MNVLEIKLASGLVVVALFLASGCSNPSRPKTVDGGGDDGGGRQTDGEGILRLMNGDEIVGLGMLKAFPPITEQPWELFFQGVDPTRETSARLSLKVPGPSTSMEGRYELGASLARDYFAYKSTPTLQWDSRSGTVELEVTGFREIRAVIDSRSKLITGEADQEYMQIQGVLEGTYVVKCYEFESKTTGQVDSDFSSEFCSQFR